ncbi:acyl carrier protein [Candidatus Beckwithbacteria bacterium]|nr:acyl carrier protein [Candidatus Beckwithbacteria bacterium]
MNKNDILYLISNILGIEMDEIQMESDFREDLNCDPNDLVELRLQLEDLLKISDLDQEDFQEEFENIETVQDLFNLIEEHSNEYFD